MGVSDGIRAGRAFVELLLKDEAFHKGLQKAGANLTKWGAAALAAGTAVGGALLGATKIFATFGDDINKASQRTGVAVKELSELAYVAGQSGTNIGALEGAIRRMQKVIADAGQGSKSATNELRKLGLTAKDLAGKSTDEQFKLIADRISQITDPTLRAAAAMSVFGKSGTQMLPMLEQGRKGIEALQRRAETLGVSLSKEQAEAATIFGDALDDIKQAALGAAVQIGGALAPKLTEIAGAITEYVARVTAFVKEHQDLVMTVAKAAAGVAAFGAALIVVGQSYLILASSIKGVSAALTLLAAHPVAAAIAGISIAAVVAANALGLLGSKTAEVSHAMTDLRAANEKQASEDKTRLARLQQLADKESLNAAQQREAKQLVDALQSRYGALGISIDKTTGAISGMTEAQQKLNAAMRDRQIIDLERELKETDQNARNLRQEQFDNWESMRNVFRSQKGIDAENERLGQEIAAENAKAKAIRAQIDALKAGGEPGAGDPAAIAARIAADESGEGNRVEAAERATDRLAELDEARKRERRSALANEIADLKARGEERGRLLEELARADAAKLEALPDELRRVQDQTASDILRAQERVAAEELKGVNDQAEAKKQAIIAAEEELAKAKIDATLKGQAREMALLKLERKKALQEAAKQGVPLRLVNEAFDAREAVLKRGDEPAKAARLSRAAGAFDIQDLQRQLTQGGRGDKQARQIKLAEEQKDAAVNMLLAMRQVLDLIRNNLVLGA